MVLEELVDTVVNDEATEVMLGDLVLPVPPRQMRVRKSAKIDEVEIPGRSGKLKLAVGYEDAQIELQMEVCAEEQGGRVIKSAKQRARMLAALFQPEAGAVPKALPIISALTEALRINRVLIKDIAINDHPDYDYYDVNLTLVEFESIENQLDEVQAQEAAVQTQISLDPRLEEALGEQEDRYLIEQAERGYQDANGPFSGTAPGEDG